MVETGLRMTYSIVIIAGLCFIGFGLQPPAPNWGTMLNENRIGLVRNPWAVVVPGDVSSPCSRSAPTRSPTRSPRVAIGVERRPEVMLTEVGVEDEESD